MRAARDVRSETAAELAGMDRGAPAPTGVDAQELRSAARDVARVVCASAEPGELGARLVRVASASAAMHMLQVSRAPAAWREHEPYDAALPSSLRQGNRA